MCVNRVKQWHGSEGWGAKLLNDALLEQAICKKIMKSFMANRNMVFRSS